MKNLFYAVLFFTLLAFCGKSFADCLATVEACKPSQAVKAEAVKAREAGDLQTAAAKYQQAAMMHPIEIYKALDLLNAEGCLVGKWHPIKGYMIVAEKAEANKALAQSLLDQVKDLIAKVDADACDYSNGVYDTVVNWHQNAQDALNGKFH